MFKLTPTSTILRLADNATIPADPANTDYVNFLSWIAAGNTPEPVDVVVTNVPQTVTRFQALAALHLAGHLPAIEAIMSNPSTPVLSKLAWDNALSFERKSPTLEGLAKALKLTDDDLDKLFITAAGIVA